NLPMVGLFAQVARVHGKYLMPIVIVFCVLGSFAVRNSFMDLWVLALFGILGYLLRKGGFSPAPLALGMIIGPMLEDTFRQSAMLFKGDFSLFFSRPLSGTMMVFIFIILAWPLLEKVLARFNIKSPLGRGVEEE
ncbi:MAG: tripartite tricarboxylate transporter permease, partial [Clostridia bacterium]|nr:tripartite tricarboxylate transporter permease [Clostridia bacterium]